VEKKEAYGSVLAKTLHLKLKKKGRGMCCALAGSAKKSLMNRGATRVADHSSSKIPVKRGGEERTLTVRRKASGGPVHREEEKIGKIPDGQLTENRLRGSATGFLGASELGKRGRSEVADSLRPKAGAREEGEEGIYQNVTVQRCPGEWCTTSKVKGKGVDLP